jgi:hypothetical protein
VISHYPHAGRELPGISRLSPPPDWASAVYFNLLAVPNGPGSAQRRDRLKALLP